MILSSFFPPEYTGRSPTEDAVAMFEKFLAFRTLEEYASIWKAEILVLA